MAKKFKDYYGRECGEVLGAKLQAAYPLFTYTDWLHAVITHTRGKEFLERQEVLVTLLDQYLPAGYQRRLQIFSKILGPELQTETGMFRMAGGCGRWGTLLCVLEQQTRTNHLILFTN